MKILKVNEIELKGDKHEVRGLMALIIGNNGYIVTSNDCVHSVHEFADMVNFAVHEKPTVNPDGSKSFDLFPAGSVKLSLDYLKEIVGDEITDLEKWVHYFGIKSKIHYNYSLLQKSCKKIKASVVFPEWK